jgi:hypothetical protein
MAGKTIVQMIQEELDAEFLKSLEIWRPRKLMPLLENRAADFISLAFLRYLMSV